MASYLVLLTPKELRDAAEWVDEHVRTVHAEEYPGPFAVRNLEGGSIVSRTVVICEACERKKVSNANHKDITDYDHA